MERQAGVGRRANESPLARLNRGLSVHTLVHVAAPLVGADGVGAGTECDAYPHRPCTADRATTRDRPYETSAEEERRNNGWCRLPLLAIDGNSIVPPAFPASAGA